MESGNALITVVVIVLVGGLLVVFPMYMIANQNDKIAQNILATETTNLVNDIITTGEFTREKLDKYDQKISATGYAFDTEYTIMILDENPSKKEILANSTKIGENVFIVVQKTQVDELLNNQQGKMLLKPGDRVNIRSTIKTSTLSMDLGSFLFGASSKDIKNMAAESSGVVTK